MSSLIDVIGIVLDVLRTFSLHKEWIGNSLLVHRQQTYTTTHTYKSVNVIWYKNRRIDCPILFSAFDKMSLLGKVALVTGASSGIGAATAIQLAKWVLWVRSFSAIAHWPITSNLPNKQLQQKIVYTCNRSGHEQTNSNCSQSVKVLMSTLLLKCHLSK